MYHAAVARRTRATFAALGRGDYEPALAGMADRFEHVFAGEHPLGGRRHTRPALRLWFERLFRLNRRLRFRVTDVTVSGWPWHTRVVVEWTDDAELADGTPYLNSGVHVVRMRWGRVVGIHAHLDTARWQEACAAMARAGISEAAAAPIEG